MYRSISAVVAKGPMALRMFGARVSATVMIKWVGEYFVQCQVVTGSLESI